MIYQSTRNKNLTATAAQAVLRGIAPDGGLYLPEAIEALHFDWQGVLRLATTQEMAAAVLGALLPGIGEMETLVRRAYTGKFETEDLTPLVKVGEDYVLELFRGPTSAFKDVALSMLPQLMTQARAQEGETKETMILTATSGDTGKAAMAGFCDVPGTRIIVFYPEEGVSPVQRAQMVTQTGENVCVCAVRGNFDDAQSGVKDAFVRCADGRLDRFGVELSSANSINIGRLAPQVVYYFKAYRDMVERGVVAVGGAVDFCVPTGNFGDILAGYFARQMGLPVGRLICASNANDVLTDFLQSGVYDRNRPFYRTCSPSMDILISSNLERLLCLTGGTEKTTQWMRELKETGHYQVDGQTLAAIRAVFAGERCDEAQTADAIRTVWEKHGYLCDTHTAVAWHAAQRHRDAARPMVILSTASPFKFPAAVLGAVGGTPAGDEFTQMETLSALTGLPIPANLRGLRDAAVRHRDVVEREDMLAYITRKAEEKKWNR